MLKNTLASPTSTAGEKLRRLASALAKHRPLLSRADQLIFLCGANHDNAPSARRKAVKDFIESRAETNRVVYAEGVFSELAKIGNKGNVLDLEHEISEIADKIIIILESESAFCELGAFAHPALRKKLIVINDAKFKQSGSFINTGPLAALRESKAPVLWYPMAPDGDRWPDAVGSIFRELEEAVYVHPFRRSERVEADLDSLETNKHSLYLVHDLVLLTGPASYQDLIDCLVCMYGKRSFDRLRKLLGILKAANLVDSSLLGGEWVFSTRSPAPYLHYTGVDASSIAATFRSYHLKLHSARFQHV